MVQPIAARCRSLGARLLCMLLPAAPAIASSEGGAPILVKGERVLVRPGTELANAAVLVLAGRIADVGTDVAAPEGARVIEGAVVCAGFLDSWSGLGIDETSRDHDDAEARTRTVDALDRFEDLHLHEEALRSGIVAVRAQAGANARVCGVGAWLRTFSEERDTNVVVLEDACVAASIGITRNGKAQDVFDRADDVEKIVSELEGGQRYAESWTDYEEKLAAWEEEIAKKREELEKDFKKAKKDREEEIEEAEEEGEEFEEKRYREDKKPRRPSRDPDDAVLARVVRGELPLVVEVHRAAQIRTLLERLEAFPRVRLVLAGATEAVAVADRIAERGVPVIVWPAVERSGAPDELRERDLALAGRLHERGVEVLFGSGGRSAATSRDLPTLAALAVGSGLDADAAFGALTLSAARAMDVGESLGSVEIGKDADLLVLDGDPLATGTRVLFVLSGGEIVVEPQ